MQPVVTNHPFALRADGTPVTITKCPPALGKGGEQSEATCRLVAQKRREWRKEQKLANEETTFV